MVIESIYPILKMVNRIYLMAKKVCVSLLNVIYKNSICMKFNNQKRMDFKHTGNDFGDRACNSSTCKSLKIQLMSVMRTFTVIWVIKMFHLNTFES